MDCVQLRLQFFHHVLHEPDERNHYRGDLIVHEVLNDEETSIKKLLFVFGLGEFIGNHVDAFLSVGVVFGKQVAEHVLVED